MKQIKLNILTFFILFQGLSAIDFNPGPYGQHYFDFAGQFKLPDLNAKLHGDVNQDETLNIQDIILYINHILSTIIFNDEQVLYADVNTDGNINIMDVTQIIFNITNDIGAEYDFRNNWDGNNSYIFIHYHSAVANSSALWNSNTKIDFINNSPDNVHYFFLSEGNNPEQMAIDMKADFDEVLQNLTEEEWIHWNSHLHFIPQRVSTINNWISEILPGKVAFAIDRFQQIRQIGYLGNPSSFTGTHLSYIAHEAHYFNYEFENIYEPNREYDEITIFDREIYTGGWASTITQLVEFPTNEELNNYSGLSVDLLRGCPDSNGNYSDQGCDDYDRIAHLYLCDGICYDEIEYSWITEQGICEQSGFSWINESCISTQYFGNESQTSCEELNYGWNYNSECYEIARWITPFDRQPHHLTDITPFLANTRPGGVKMIKYQESGWPNSLLTLKLRLYSEEAESTPQSFIPIWNGTVQFNPNYGDNRPATQFEVPENATKVEFVSYITGHGWGSNGCFNCSEFCNSNHIFSINGGEYEFSKDHPEASANNHCMSIEMISQGTIPNQYGTWGYGRAGWCPGLDVEPFITDLTNHVYIGASNIIDYDACRVSGNSCVTPPVCQGDGYCPEIAMSSYIIISY